MKGLRLYKKEKLCSTVAVEQLFMRGSGAAGALDYPLRAVWRSNQRRRSDAPVAFLITVPKKRLRHAVDRVTMRRRIREAWRLNRAGLRAAVGSAGGVRTFSVAFIYLADKNVGYPKVEQSMKRLLAKMEKRYFPDDAERQD